MKELLNEPDYHKLGDWLDSIMANSSDIVDNVDFMSSIVVKLANDKAEERSKLLQGLKDSQMECDNLEQETMVSRETINNLKAEIVRIQALYEAEKRARIIAEQTISDNNAIYERQINRQEIGDTASQPVFAGYDITVQRDGADRPMKYILTPKE